MLHLPHKLASLQPSSQFPWIPRWKTSVSRPLNDHMTAHPKGCSLRLTWIIWQWHFYFAEKDIRDFFLLSRRNKVLRNAGFYKFRHALNEKDFWEEKWNESVSLSLSLSLSLTHTHTHSHSFSWTHTRSLILSLFLICVHSSESVSYKWWKIYPRKWDAAHDTHYEREDGQLNEWTDEQMNRQTDEQIDMWTVEQMNRQKVEQTDRRTDRYVNSWTNGLMNRWTDRQTNR